MRNPTIRVLIGIGLVVVVGVGIYLFRPLFVDTVVDEEFPASDDGSAPAGDDVATALPTDPVVPDGMTADEVSSEMAAAADSEDVEEVEPMPEAGPTAVVSGEFTGADEFHMGSGTATIYELEDGTSILRLEDFMVTNGPDLRVYLAPVVDGVPQINADAIDLGMLKGNVGNQNYDIPPDYDTTQPLAVVIWCQPFSVTFATAGLT